MILSTAALCLALNIYHESRGENMTGQHAVAQVTMNRAGRNPDKVCKVVFAPKQFSWANPLTSRQGAARQALAGKYVPRDQKAWAVAKSVAYNSINGYIRDFTHGSTHYHASWVSPSWSRNMTLVGTYGSHLFYKQS